MAVSTFYFKERSPEYNLWLKRSQKVEPIVWIWVQPKLSRQQKTLGKFCFWEESTPGCFKAALVSQYLTDTLYAGFHLLQLVCPAPQGVHLYALLAYSAVQLCDDLLLLCAVALSLIT